MDSDELRRWWAERSGEYSPAYYAHYGPDERSEMVRDALDGLVGRDASVLELGCSSGRHLAHLLDHGYDDVAGIELNGDAFDVMAETYPELAAGGTFYHAAIEDVVGEFDDAQFDAVFSVETLQHLHPDVEWVFGELARITGDVLVTVENEGEPDEAAPPESEDTAVRDGIPLYYRDWHAIFTDLGLVEVEVRTGERDTLRAFRASAD